MLLPVRAVNTLLSMSWGGELGTGGKMAVSAKTGFAFHFTALQILLTLARHNSLLFQKWHQTDFKANTEIPFTLHLCHSIHYLSSLRSESSESTSSKKLILPDLMNFQCGALVAHGHRAKHHLSKHVGIWGAPRTLWKTNPTTFSFKHFRGTVPLREYNTNTRENIPYLKDKYAKYLAGTLLNMLSCNPDNANKRKWSSRWLWAQPLKPCNKPSPPRWEQADSNSPEPGD